MARAVRDSVDQKWWQPPNLAAGPDGLLITAQSHSAEGYLGASWITTDALAPEQVADPLEVWTLAIDRE